MQRDIDQLQRIPAVRLTDTWLNQWTSAHTIWYGAVRFSNTHFRRCRHGDPAFNSTPVNTLITRTAVYARALFTYVNEGKYTFCTPGHMAGEQAYQKIAVGCLLLRFSRRQHAESGCVDLGTELLGSVLDHPVPHLEAEGCIAPYLWRRQSYMVTNGTSTSNKIVRDVHRACRQYAAD
ncbi:hypothetical protein ACNKHS_01240 [Shigella flexneri]